MTQQHIVVRRIVIRGRVQGVGYRAWTEAEAHARGVEGWVRNRRDGTVEAVLAGSEEGIVAMIGVCRVGPRGANVSAIDELEDTATALAQRRPGERFSVLATV